MYIRCVVSAVGVPPVHSVRCVVSAVGVPPVHSVRCVVSPVGVPPVHSVRCVVSAEGASSAVLAPPLPYLHVLLHRHAVFGESGSRLSSSGSALFVSMFVHV